MIYDDGSDDSDYGQDSSLLVGDEEVMIPSVDWEVVKDHAQYTGQSELCLLLDDILADVRIGPKDTVTGKRLMWARQAGRQVANIVPIEGAAPSGVTDTEDMLDTQWILSKLQAESHDDACLLWTLLKYKYPSLSGTSLQAEVATPAPTVGSWECLCGHLNVGFKATCESCSAHPPSGWWKKDTKGPKLPSLGKDAVPTATQGVAIPRPAPHITCQITWDGSKAGWTLRNDDLVVLSVDTGSAAETGGLIPGMRLVAIGNTVLTSVSDVRDALQTVGQTFEITVSIEPVTRLKATNSLTSDDGIVAVVLHKGPQDRMGTNWESKTNLILRSVEKGTHADHAGLSALIGWRLTHVNTCPVKSSDDIIREATGQGVLPLYWARVTPAPPVFPRVLAEQKNLIGGAGQVLSRPAMVSTFAPSFLWVIAPERVQHCGGLYRLDPEKVNGMPLWRHAVNNQLLYSSTKGLWCVSDSSDTGHGWIFSMLPSSMGMPDVITEWEAMGEADGSIKVVSTLPIPGLLKVDAGKMDTEQLRGTYSLIRDVDDTTLPFKVVNGMPAWKSVDKERWVYSSGKGSWMITDDIRDFAKSGGVMASTVGHGGMMPYEVRVWQHKTGVEKPDFKISIGGGADEENELPKANMTASVHENAVWGYKDLGNFSLSAHLHKLNTNYGNLLWVSGENPHQGWLGIDLSNEDERGQLVRILTELVDQEFIQVRQPVVAGVTVKAACNIHTPEGHTITAGSTGQVISVVMSRAPIGNSPPRMAKVNFNGTKTVTVSYGQVWPVQSTFERGAKVRVLAVDAVAVVDSETVSSGGVGVRGKYRVKYATGKTYHVRNFALINADKPWGDGDEAPANASFKEGTKIELSTDVVFTTMEALPQGTVGVITNYGQDIEVLAGGLLFNVHSDQIKTVEPKYAKGELVVPLIHSGLPHDCWGCGRIETVIGNEYTLATPTGNVVVNSVASLHFVLGQNVLATNGAEDWKQGVVVRVLACGVPLISMGNEPPQKYWYVKHFWDAPPSATPYMAQSEAHSDDADPLVTMQSYISMDLAMLREAEIMRRKWIEAQRSKETVQLKLATMKSILEVKKMESATNTITLRKGQTEKMGTVFYGENHLVLTAVADGSPAQKCGVGRFIGRILIGIDGVPVQTAGNIKTAAAGKQVMNLEFRQSPPCPAGHPMRVCITDRSKPGMCPGCFKSYGEAYFACRECHYDVCGSCGQDSHSPSDQQQLQQQQQQQQQIHRQQQQERLLEEQAAAQAAALLLQQQQQQQLLQYQQMQMYQQQQQQQQQLETSGNSWGRAALSGELDTNGSSGGWGRSLLAEEGVAVAPVTEQVKVEAVEEKEQEEEEEATAPAELLSLLDSVIANPQEEEEEEELPENDPLGVHLSNLLSRVNELPSSPGSPPEVSRGHSLNSAEIYQDAYLAINPWAVEKKNY
eukprot:TRINITY_DN15657_c0_g4_i2.p1 TRINITY_DN15657_c0_g4~~TRINITY_DN15657_c0_g4_i2.p1  ORF type:complete len:1431 (+),score=379.50 TRINITY_DN15657_c0_g4_i2:103-4395(+)